MGLVGVLLLWAPAWLLGSWIARVIESSPDSSRESNRVTVEFGPDHRTVVLTAELRGTGPAAESGLCEVCHANWVVGGLALGDGLTLVGKGKLPSTEVFEIKGPMEPTGPPVTRNASAWQRAEYHVEVDGEGTWISQFQRQTLRLSLSGELAAGERVVAEVHLEVRNEDLMPTGVSLAFPDDVELRLWTED